MRAVTRAQYHEKRTLSGLSSEIYRDRLGNLGAAISADQIFVNASAGDFRLKTGSPAIGMGVPISGISTDITGKARDSAHPSIGAFEGEGGPSSGVPAVIQEVPTSGGGSTQVPTPTEVVQASSGGFGGLGTAALIFGLGFLFVVLTD